MFTELADESAPKKTRKKPSLKGSIKDEEAEPVRMGKLASTEPLTAEVSEKSQKSQKQAIAEAACLEMPTESVKGQLGEASARGRVSSSKMKDTSENVGNKPRIRDQVTFVYNKIHT